MQTLDIWKEKSSFLIQKDTSLTKRQSEWICVCDKCQNERIITYSQAWNLVKNKSSKTCKKCQFEFKLRVMTIPPKATTESQKKAAKSRIGIKRLKNKEIIKYRQLFAPETLTNPKMRKKQSLAKLGKIGPLASRWEGGKTKERQLLMKRHEYKSLRMSVFSRDGFKCVKCLSNKNIEMDHIKEWCNYPELRYEITNCRTLCHECHSKTDNYGYKAKKVNKDHGN